MSGFDVIHFAMFAKYWEPGQVKTRLGRTIGDQAACDLHFMFLQHLVKRFDRFGDRRTLVFSPPESKRAFRHFLPESWHLRPQAGGDLGVRMKTFFQNSATLPAVRTMLIGSDTPDIPVAFANQAAGMLNDVPVVLGPSTDGGYYLIAMNGFCNIFDNIPWSTDQVLPLTLARLEEQDIDYRLLPQLTDIDEIADLKMLRRSLAAKDRDALDSDLFARLNQLQLEIPDD